MKMMRTVDLSAAPAAAHYLGFQSRAMAALPPFSRFCYCSFMRHDALVFFPL